MRRGLSYSKRISYTWARFPVARGGGAALSPLPYLELWRFWF